MVPLEQRINYLESIQAKPVLCAFCSFLRKQPYEYAEKETLNETDRIYFDLISAISQQSKNKFDKPYQLITKRLPDKNSNAPFIHNDYLIYVLIIGVLLFKHDRQWITHILSIRSKNAVTQSFQHILAENYYNKLDESQLTYCALLFIDNSRITNELQNSTYDHLTHRPALFSENNDLLILCGLQAYDEIIKSREIGDDASLKRLQHFETLFLKRINIFSNIIYNLLLLTLFYNLWILLTTSSSAKDQINNIGLLFSLAGTGLANLLRFVPRYLTTTLAKILGYRYTKDKN
jgi:hypothetical protein